MPLELLIEVIAAFTTSLLFTTIVYLLRRSERRSRAIEQSARALTDYIQTISPPSEISIAQRKKQAILNAGPKTFYYLDESQVKDLYPQVVQELEPTRIEKRETKEARGGIAAKLRFFEPKYERGKAEEKTEVYEVERTTSMMYNTIEKYLLERGKILFGLEEFEFDQSSINDLKSTFEQLRKESVMVEVLDALENRFVSDKMTEFALEHVEKLSDSSGYVAIQSEFSVTHIPNAVYILTFVHPINEHLPAHYPEVRMCLSCVKDCITPSGRSTFTKDKSVKITCLGKVVSWSDENKVLEISPIAIY